MRSTTLLGLAALAYVASASATESECDSKCLHQKIADLAATNADLAATNAAQTTEIRQLRLEASGKGPAALRVGEAVGRRRRRKKFSSSRPTPSFTPDAAFTTAFFFKDCKASGKTCPTASKCMKGSTSRERNALCYGSGSYDVAQCKGGWDWTPSLQYTSEFSPRGKCDSSNAAYDKGTKKQSVAPLTTRCYGTVMDSKWVCSKAGVMFQTSSVKDNNVPNSAKYMQMMVYGLGAKYIECKHVKCPKKTSASAKRQLLGRQQLKKKEKEESCRDCTVKKKGKCLSLCFVTKGSDTAAYDISGTAAKCNGGSKKRVQDGVRWWTGAEMCCFDNCKVPDRSEYNFIKDIAKAEPASQLLGLL